MSNKQERRNVPIGGGCETFDTAQWAFQDDPCKVSAGGYLAAAMEYSEDDMIGDDTFLNALAEIRDWLLDSDNAKA